MELEREGRRPLLALDPPLVRSSGGREAADVEKCRREMRRRIWMEKKIKINGIFAYMYDHQKCMDPSGTSLRC